jgi:CPA2 family monovalent cation:H+ antiporter-2
MPASEAVWFGAMISVSSTMVVLKTLAAAGVLSTLASRVMIGLLVVQDLAVVPMLIILPQLQSLDGIVPKLARSLGIAAVFLLAVVLIGTRVLPGLLKKIISWGSRELFLVAVVAVGVGVGYATHKVGLSFALGAFVAGMILSESEFSHQALSDVVPLRDIFGLLFFVTVGMLFDPNYALSNLGLIALAVALIFIGKALIIGLSTRALGYVNMAPWIVGLGLAHIGEFSFVLARTGYSAKLISKSTYDLALTSTVITMAFAPLLSRMALPLGRLWRSWHKPAPPAANIELPETALAGHVIVAGYGRTGHTIAQALAESGTPFIVVELDYPILEDVTRAGFQGIWGDITRDEILHAAGIARARMLLLATPDQNTASLAIEHARRLNPGIIVIARAVRRHHVRELKKLGAAAVIQPEFEGGIEMVRQALLRAETTRDGAAAILDRLRAGYEGA